MQGLRSPSKQEKNSPTRLNPKICRTFAKAKALVAKLVDAPDLGSGDFGRVGSSPIRRTFFICYTNQHPFPWRCFFFLHTFFIIFLYRIWKIFRCFFSLRTFLYMLHELAPLPMEVPFLFAQSPHSSDAPVHKSSPKCFSAEPLPTCFTAQAGGLLSYALCPS